MKKIDNQEVATNKGKFFERMSKKYPEQDFSDEEALYGRINEDYDSYDAGMTERDDRIGKLEADRKQFSDLFSQNPKAARFFSSWVRGGDPFIAMLKELGPELKDALEDPANAEEIAKAYKEHADRTAKNKQYEDEYQTNLAASLAEVDKLEQEGMNPELLDQAIAAVFKVATDASKGIITRETINIMAKSLNYDSDVANAEEEGVIRGRNQRIDEKLRKSRKGDGLAQIGGNGGGAINRPLPSMGALDNYSDSGPMNIYERGGEKRIKN